MDKDIRVFINKLAEKVISAYNIEIPIIDIEDVVKKMGGKVVRKDNFADLADGTIKKTGNMSFEIAISTLQSEGRKNFTIAHELGHLFLHMGFRTNRESWENQKNKKYQRYGSSRQEYQANEFAAALLMPKKEYKRIFFQNIQDNYVDMTNVANYFGVSVEAARIRGKFLGYLEW